MNSENKSWYFPNAKCAEIFCQTSTCFTISCTHCDLKTSEFEDFLNHFRREHFKELEGLFFADIKCEEPFADVKCEEPFDMPEVDNPEEGDARLIPEGNLIVGDKEQEMNMKYPLDELSRIKINEHDLRREESNGTYKQETFDTEEENPGGTSSTIEKQQNGELYCDLCDKHFQNLTGLKSHTTTVHGCSPDLLFELRHKKSRTFQCKECLKIFTRKGGLNRHSVTHTGEKPHKCKVCGKGFGRVDSLNKHILAHGHKNIVWNEEINGFALSTTTRLHESKIQKKRSGEFHCELCDNNYKNLAGLKTHTTKMHDCSQDFLFKFYDKKYQNFQCKECLRVFNDKGILNRHIATHTGKKPHKCKVCGKCFGRADTLTRHSLTHGRNRD